MSETLSLWALFLGSLLSATILPGGSEVAFLAFIKSFPHLTGPALASATLGNTLGGISSYLLGRFLPIKNKLQGLASLERYGPPLLLLSWVPLLGDPLCVAAGWLRLNHVACAVYMAVGKLARYALIAWFIL